MKSVRLNSVLGLPVLWRGLVLGVLVLSILLGPVLASGLALLHVHGPEGLHEHVLPSLVSRGDPASLPVWHEGEHGVADHSVSEHAAHERVSHEGESGGKHVEDVPGHVPHGIVVELAVSPMSRPELQTRTAVQGSALGSELPALLVGDADPLSLAGLVPDGRARRAVRDGRCTGALRVLCLNGGLLI